MRVRAAALLATVISLAGCQPPKTTEADVPVKRSPVVVADRDLGGHDLHVDADTIISGDRPRLYVSCTFGSYHVSFDVMEPPPLPPPLAGAMGMVEIDRDRWSTEMSIGDINGGMWTPRDRKMDSVFAKHILDSDEVRFRAPAGFGPDKVIIWRLNGIRGPVQKLRDCK